MFVLRDIPRKSLHAAHAEKPEHSNAYAYYVFGKR